MPIFNYSVRRRGIEWQKTIVDEGLRGTPDRRRLKRHTETPLKQLLCQCEVNTSTMSSDPIPEAFLPAFRPAALPGSLPRETPQRISLAPNAVRPCGGPVFSRIRKSRAAVTARMMAKMHASGAYSGLPSAGSARARAGSRGRSAAGITPLVRRERDAATPRGRSRASRKSQGRDDRCRKPRTRCEPRRPRRSRCPRSRRNAPGDN
jgi:hypothetical protein